MDGNAHKEAKEVFDELEQKVWDDTINDSVELLDRKYHAAVYPLETLIKGVKLTTYIFRDINTGETFHEIEELKEHQKCDTCTNEVAHQLDDYNLCGCCYKEAVKHKLMDFSYDLRIKLSKN